MIVRYLGETGRGVVDGVIYADSLDEAADAAAVHACGGHWRAPAITPSSTGPNGAAGRLVGLFGGGSLAAEAAHVLAGHGLPTGTPESALRAGRALPGDGHLIVDTGDDVYTVGRPHPMIDQTARCDLIRAIGGDPGVGLLLLDLVLGDGSHADPAPEIAEAVIHARRSRATPLAVVCSVCGTAADPQGLLRQEQVLREAGIEVTATAAQAASRASGLLGAGVGRRS